MASNIERRGEFSPIIPKTIIPDTLRRESYDEFLNRIRALKSQTDPNADEYGKISQQAIDRIINHTIFYILI